MRSQRRRLGSTPTYLGTLTVCLVLFVSPSTATDYRIDGFVVDAAHEPVPLATVSLEGTRISAITDTLGVFVFEKVPEGHYALSARKGCSLTGYIPSFAVPRPLKVPLPVVTHRISCREPIDVLALPIGEQGSLIGNAFESAVRPERLELARAVAGDGAITFVSLNAPAAEARLGNGSTVPIVDAADIRDSESAALGQMGLSFCLTVPDSETVLVLVELVDGATDTEFDLLVAEQALFTYQREHAGGWRLIHRLFCMSESDLPPDDSDGRRP